MYHLLADAVIIIHFLFILFVVGGGLLVIIWPRVAFLHLPASIWGAAVEMFGWVCPLTPMENRFRCLAGENSYSGDFVLQYLMPAIYPEYLTPSIQKILGAGVIAVNIVFYWMAIRKHRKHF